MLLVLKTAVIQTKTRVQADDVSAYKAIRYFSSDFDRKRIDEKNCMNFHIKKFHNYRKIRCVYRFLFDFILYAFKHDKKLIEIFYIKIQ